MPKCAGGHRVPVAQLPHEPAKARGCSTTHPEVHAGIISLSEASALADESRPVSLLMSCVGGVDCGDEVGHVVAWRRLSRIALSRVTAPVKFVGLGGQALAQHAVVGAGFLEFVDLGPATSPEPALTAIAWLGGRDRRH